MGNSEKKDIIERTGDFATDTVNVAGKAEQAAGTVVQTGGKAIETTGTAVQATGKGVETAGKGMQTAGRGVKNTGRQINNQGRNIRKQGQNISRHGENIKLQGKQLSDEAKDLKQINHEFADERKNNKKGRFNIKGLDFLGNNGEQKLKIGLIASGAGCAVFGLIIICIIGAIFAFVASVSDALSPVTDFFASLGNWFAGDGWCPNDVECAKLAESDFYTKIDDLYKKYEKNEGVSLDTEVLTAAALYNRFDNFSGVTTDSTDESNDDQATNDEEKKDAYKEGKDRLEKLAKNMVSNDKLSYSSFKKYLVNTYIPEYYKNLYETYPSDEQKYVKNFHANAILSFSANMDAYEAFSDSGLINKHCSSVKIFDENGQSIEEMKLEDYVKSVVQKHASSFHEETRKSFAIAIRTYVIDTTDYCENSLVKGEDLIDYDKNVSEDVKKSVEDVANLVMYYNDKTFDASYDNFTGECDLSNNKCESSPYKKEPSEATHKFEIDMSKVLIPSDKISSNSSSRGLSLYGSQSMSINGSKYEDILKTFYANDIQIKKLTVFDSDYIGGGGIFDDMLYPVGWPNKTGQCASFGWCYNHIGSWSGTCYPGQSDYHASIDLLCATMGYSGECNQIPIIAAHSGVITSVHKNNWCANPNYWNADTRLPYINGCNGNSVIIKVTDQTSDAFGYQEWYWHFDYVSAELQVGDTVEAGQFLGYMGSTGMSTAPHLHFEVKDPAGNNVLTDNNFRAYCETHVKNGD